MISRIIDLSPSLVCEEFDKNTNTFTIKNVNDTTYYFNIFENIDITINVINSKVTIIKNYQKDVIKCHIKITIDENSYLNRCSFIVSNSNSLSINRDVDNFGEYQSMQIDLSNTNVDSIENINLLKENATTNVIDGIYAVLKSAKKYQTNLNHFAALCTSKAKIYAINNDEAHVSIYTDAYIKNKASGSKTNQEGRIINLSSSCFGIVLPNLHIDENDVEASHSCSVGSINQDHMYYLQSRGLSALEARNILIRGYFNPILENISDENLLDEINKVLDKRIVNYD
ncbi:MAG: SufD family Fe-S cluster assembly protein [Erysipelotrichaceae bacterium]|nr:SufD family Fe-S cluster assembly protein [Erysipelotrichaceae bacterium]